MAQSGGMPNPRTIRLVRLVDVIGLAVVLALGLSFVFVAADTTIHLWLLAAWCVASTTYLTIAAIFVWRMSHVTAPASVTGSIQTVTGPVSIGPPSLPNRVAAIATTIASSLIGIAAAVTMLLLRDDPLVGTTIDILGVWAMLLAWAFLHWGYAQLYYGLHFSSAEPAFRFPLTTHPRLVDFVYLAFTIGTSFTGNDVSTSSRVRLTVLWHSVISFFFNGFIVVLAVNTITGSGGLSGWGQ
jgi:uncharacterized membrane protein